MLPITIVTESLSAGGRPETLRESGEARGPDTPDIHRYFPEWADRQVRPGGYLEAARNSYLAGGYAEEFGYGDERGCRLGVCLVVDDPERCCLWSTQIGGLPPGYPEYATPNERDSHGGSGYHRDGSVEQPRAQPSGDGPPAVRGHVLVCRVREHVRPVSGILSVWRDLRIRRRGLKRFL